MKNVRGDFMKKWLQKILVATVAFLTFGLINPNHEIWDALNQGQPSNNHNSNYGENNTTNHAEQIEAINTDEELYNDFVINRDQFIQPILSSAKEQSYIKFGSRIAPVIENEFEQHIFPKLEQAIEMTLAKVDDQSLRCLKITEQPSGQYAEKIFNISDGMSGTDLIRVHVRTENRPKEGYYYNFHYHTYDDQFIAHHNIGDIYWSKNTPPKWLS